MQPEGQATTVFVGNCAGWSGWSSGFIWILGSPSISFLLISQCRATDASNRCSNASQSLSLWNFNRSAFKLESKQGRMEGYGRCVVCSIVIRRWQELKMGAEMCRAHLLFGPQPFQWSAKHFQMHRKHRRTTLTNLWPRAEQTKTNLSTIVATASWESPVEPFQWGWASTSIQNKIKQY